MFDSLGSMQLSFDAADRLVELVQARRGAVTAEEAARVLFALERAPATLARSLLGDVVEGDARLAWLGARVGLATRTPGRPRSRTRSSSSSTSRRPGSRRAATASARSAPSASARSRSPRRSRRSSTRHARSRPIVAADRDPPVDLRGAPRPETAVRRFLAFAGDAPLAAHNARFDLGFLDREVERLTGRRVAAPVVDTVWLARRLLQAAASASRSCSSRTSSAPRPSRATARSRTRSRPRRS